MGSHITVLAVSPLADAIARTSTAEAVTFWILGAIALIGAIGVVTATKAVYSTLFLATTMLTLAILYFIQDAMFLGIVQVVVYTGAVMMMFLFVLMFIGVDSPESLVETIRGHRIATTLIGIGFAVLLIGALGSVSFGYVGLTDANAAGNVEGLAQLIFTRYLWAFELTGALLITAVVAAMVLAHQERLTPRPTQRELSIERFKNGSHPTPLPTPGVYARHNAVDVAALLPDGSYSSLSVSDLLTHRWVDSQGNAYHPAQAPQPTEHQVEDQERHDVELDRQELITHLTHTDHQTGES